ncbi:ASCH domain-containing protein [Pontivivens insulae]|uniref:ASCH domain-containing protein n=1 Tax=Pontivivens insulae TaxID=1639689 RepID=A0A2R8A987_9RHOB|nr:ASCH domain-containing protein [Pontivivens insulae]RED12685.1 uncharacterized protein YhfF [Pontivivens insulae]SPF28776.1 hypothetical protein POI8812_01079 [Pontivivens insulae]
MNVEALQKKYPGAQPYRMGDNDALTAELLALVRAGVKRATCTAMIDVEEGREALPMLGRCDICMAPDGTPAVVTRTAELRELRFCDMTAEMALAEGEDDSLDSWRAGHRRYYERQGIFHPEMQLIWERFEVVEDFAR